MFLSSARLEDAATASETKSSTSEQHALCEERRWQVGIEIPPGLWHPASCWCSRDSQQGSALHKTRATGAQAIQMMSCHLLNGDEKKKRKQHYFSAILNASQIWSPADAFVPVLWQQQGTEGSGGEHFCRHQLNDSESHLLMEGGEHERYHLMEHLKSLIIYNKNRISIANAWSQLPLQQLFFIPLP